MPVITKGDKNCSFAVLHLYMAYNCKNDRQQMVSRMKKLKPKDKIKLYGGYDMDPPWLKDRDYHYATVLRFIDNKIEKRKNDERLSAVIEFDNDFEFKGFKGKFGVIMGRLEGQQWETKGTVHVYLLLSEIMKQEEMTEENSRWVESHASYEKMKG